jgi:poly(hydroxyalkanoate) granule-associated protein
MVKKFSKAAEAADTNLLGTVKESSTQIWLAGLGAFSKAQEEGSKVFEALVKEGAGLQKKVRKFADAQVADVTNEVSGKITEATSKAAGA